jgi:hypothetical protein
VLNQNNVSGGQATISCATAAQRPMPTGNLQPQTQPQCDTAATNAVAISHQLNSEKKVGLSVSNCVIYRDLSIF